jgi:hypothetical protein
VSRSTDDRESDELEVLEPIEAVADPTRTSDRRPSRLSKQATSVIVLGALIATIALIVVIGTRSRGSHKQSAVASTSASPSTVLLGPSFRYFGTLHTRLGDATMVCGEEAMPVCGTGTDLEFVACPDSLVAYYGSIRRDAATEKRIVELIHRQPPSGSYWLWACGRDFRGGVLH